MTDIMDLTYPGQRTATATSCIPHDGVYMPWPRAGKSENGFFRYDTWLQIFQNDSKICEAKVTLTPLINKICKPRKKYRMQTQQLNTFIHTNFRFKRMLDAGKALMWVKNIADFGRFWYLNNPFLRIISLEYLWVPQTMNSHICIWKLKDRFLCWSPEAIFVPLKGTPTCRLSTEPYRGGHGGLRYCGYELFFKRYFGNFNFNVRYYGII